MRPERLARADEARMKGDTCPPCTPSPRRARGVLSRPTRDHADPTAATGDGENGNTGNGRN